MIYASSLMIWIDVYEHWERLEAVQTENNVRAGEFKCIAIGATLHNHAETLSPYVDIRNECPTILSSINK